ncbi:hypothetical protein G9A89_001644 [Geosiphon pyriformis]|nr:hypothetical protein G9A89_001644 [Geosiphon pyriformis]
MEKMIDLEEGFNWYLKAAKNGDHLREQEVGICYSYAIWTDYNPKTAIGWFQKAVDADSSQSYKSGYRNAPFYIGKFFAGSFGFKRYIRRALSWYQISAKLGFNRGVRETTRCYAQDIGTNKDFHEALRTLSISKEKNFLFSLGLMVE